MKLYGSKGRTIDVEFCLDTRLVAYGRALDPGRRTFAPIGPSGSRTYGPRPWGRCRETGEPCTASRPPGEPAHTVGRGWGSRGPTALLGCWPVCKWRSHT